MSQLAAQLQQDALLRLQQSQEAATPQDGMKVEGQVAEMEEDHPRFTPDDGSGHDESANSSAGEGSSTSPGGGSKGSRTSSSSGETGSKKRKPKLKLEQITQRLQDKCSPEGVRNREKF